MGLAYNLESTQNLYLTMGLSKYFVEFPNYLQWRINFTTVGGITAPVGGNSYPRFANGPIDSSYTNSAQVLNTGNPANATNPPSANANPQLPTCFFTQTNTTIEDDNGWLLRWCGRRE